ncbi:hypothetical protein ACTXT7_007751 [Hymenolepis weldensis]
MNGSKHYHQQQISDEATDRSPVVIVVNANHGPGNLILEVSPSPGGNSEASSSSVSSGANGSTSLFVTAKHIQISKALLELAKTNGALLDSSWYLVLNTMQRDVTNERQEAFILKAYAERAMSKSLSDPHI